MTLSEWIYWYVRFIIRYSSVVMQTVANGAKKELLYASLTNRERNHIIPSSVNPWHMLIICSHVVPSTFSCGFITTYYCFAHFNHKVRKPYSIQSVLCIHVCMYSYAEKDAQTRNHFDTNDFHLLEAISMMYIWISLYSSPLSLLHMMRTCCLCNNFTAFYKLATISF